MAYWFTVEEYLAVRDVLRAHPAGLSSSDTVKQTHLKIKRWICPEMYGHGWLIRHGRGVKGDPYRYSLPDEGGGTAPILSLQEQVSLGSFDLTEIS